MTAMAAPTPLPYRRLLVPLATLALAAGVVAGSGASFTSSSANTGNSIASGSLTQTNSKANSAVFTLANAKPGDTVVGTVTLTNSGTLPATMTLSELAAVNGFTTKSNLVLTVTDVTDTANRVQRWTGTFATLGSLPLGTWAAGERHDYEFAVTLKSTADNTEQNKSASATYQWDGIQTAGVTTTLP
jgi:hypothetical protein